MKIAVMGSGGVGGYFGARLAEGGADVAFVARGAHLDAMRDNGLVIEGGARPIHLKSVRAVADPAEIGPVDVVLFAVKLWDTEAALALIKPIVQPDTAIISFQNGVLKDEYVRRAFDARQVMGGAAYVATQIARPGCIRQTGAMQRLVFGEFDGARSKRAEDFLAVCLKGEIDADLSTDIKREIWQKFVFLVGISGCTSTMRTTIGPIRENPQARAFLLDVMREVVAVGRAHGIDLPEDYAEGRLKHADGLPHEMTSSLHHDLEAGRPLEAPWLAGGVVQLGQSLSVPTPLNRAIADILALRASGASGGQSEACPPFQR